MEDWFVVGLQGVMLLIVLVASITDSRSGLIPNWLTIPPIVLAPLAYLLTAGIDGLLSSLIGLLVCSLVPLLVFYRKGMAGGDVKLFAALGALGGVELGLEAQFLAFVVASIYALGKLTWNGTLWASLHNSVYVLFNPALPKRLRKPLPRELMNKIRLGAAIGLGTLIAVVGSHSYLWS